MDNQIKELIAVGASVTANCQPCLEHHTGKARDSGANEQQIKEAIAVAKMVRKGATNKSDESAATSGFDAEPYKPIELQLKLLKQALKGSVAKIKTQCCGEGGKPPCDWSSHECRQ